MKFSWGGALVAASALLCSCNSGRSTGTPVQRPTAGWRLALPSPAKSAEQQEALDRRSAAQEVGEITEEYDEFTKRTTISLKDMSVRADDGSRIKVFIVGTPGKAEARFLFVSTSRSWRYLQCHAVHFLADQVPVPLSNEADHDGSITSGQVLEVVGVNLTADNFAQVSSATELKARICSTVFNFKPWHVAQVAAFAAAQGSGPSDSRPPEHSSSVTPTP